ncbi:TRAP transporter large permease subunit [Burkholderia sp. Bp8998]|uniref:TRAP transporter large permease subunit n=1 Tax=Burkholderia sp. Bp8998 TaxID=2184557 RepID=UPI000F97C246|nr:hypothetical protein DIE06_35505 [Burkholderia sp. Bp8998]
MPDDRARPCLRRLLDRCIPFGHRHRAAVCRRSRTTIAHVLEIHESHYSIIATISMGLGLFSPPFGADYYSDYAIGNTNLDDGAQPIWHHLVLLLIGITIVASFPLLGMGLIQAP